MVAAVLHLDKGARAAVRSRRPVRRGLAHRHDVVDPHRARRRCVGRQAAGARLFGIAQHQVDLGHGGEGLRLDLGGAAGDDDPRARPLARAAPRIAWRAWRTASAVTAQVLTTTASAAGARRRARITSDS